MKVYLDTCCYNRPFDDQSQDRIRLESQAVLTILIHVQAQEWILLGSTALEDEIRRNPDEQRRHRVRRLVAQSHEVVVLDEHVENRARTLLGLGFHPFDALHLACAEKGGADILLTTDDQFLKTALRHQSRLKVLVRNPLTWLMETIP